MSSNRAEFGIKAAFLAFIMALTGLIVAFAVAPSGKGITSFQTINSNKSKNEEAYRDSNGTDSSVASENDIPFKVASVIDGDTIVIDYFGSEEYLRLIGVNTPEVDGPYTEEECYGAEASAFTKSLLEGQWITIESDGTQPDRDKYNRLLRYVYLAGVDFGDYIIDEGYGYEYTYGVPYLKQEEYKESQSAAKNANKGLWASCYVSKSDDDAAPIEEGNTANEVVHVYGENGDCNIKGNISYSTGEKIYHMPWQENYWDTVISPEYGERWFCSEEEAVSAGWRKARN